jgi:O-antigen/teichoic acid export membrane protein
MRRSLSSVAVLATATGGGQAIVALASPVLTRVYGPEDFGDYSAAIAIVSVLAVLACLRYEQAIPLPVDEASAAALIVLCLVIGGITTLVTGFFLLVASTAIGHALGIDRFVDLILPIVVAAMGGSAYLALSSWAVRAAAFGDLARTRLTQAVGLVGAQLGLGAMGFKVQGLMLGDALGRSGGTGRLAISAIRRMPELRDVSLQSVIAVAVRYRRFPLLSAPSAFLDVASLQAPTFLILALFGPVVGGWYLLASRVATMPNALAASAVGPVFVSESVRSERTDRAAVRTAFSTTVRRLFLIGLGPATLLVVGGPTLFPLAFGEEWHEAGVFAAVLAPMFLAQLVTSPVSGILIVLERQDLHLAREIVGVGVITLAFAIAVTSRLPPLGVVALISIGGTINAAIYLFVMRRALGDEVSR